MERIYPMKDWSTDEFGRAFSVFDRFEYLGYFVTSMPIVGHFEPWLNGLIEALDTLETNAATVRKHFAYRGNSKNLLSYLHSRYPEPHFGVVIKNFKSAPPKQKANQ